MREQNFLNKSIAEFNEATNKIMAAYGRLEQEFAKLNRELEKKNLELEKLIGEKEDVKSYLDCILESLTTGVVVVDSRGVIQSLNRCAEKFLASSREDLAGRNIRDSLAGFSCADWDHLLNTEGLASEVGQRVTINDRAMDIFSSPFRARNGAIMGVVLVLVDVTKMRDLQDIAKRSERLAAMGELAANIAHEIRNPLGSIELFSSLLLKDLPENKNRQRALQIIGSVRNINSKISNLLFFAAPNPPRLENIFLDDIIREIISFAETIISQAGISLDVELGDSRPVVLGDAEMLKQVFLNLILNALQAMPSGGQLSFKSRLVKAKADGSGNSRFQEVLVADTGTGIPDAVVSRIFDPFFSTREGSSGLGLAIAHNIISLHHGYINVRSRIGQGSVFTVALPTRETSG